MDPASMLIAALFVSAVITRLPQALADHHEAKKAAAAGEWGHLRDMRGARDAAAAARAERRARWAERIYDDWQARGRGEKRPGFFAWLSEVWHGAWEDALERRAARRGTREPFDPSSPTWWDRAWAWGKNKADQRRRREPSSGEEPVKERGGADGQPGDIPSHHPEPDHKPDQPQDAEVDDERPWQQMCLWQVNGCGCGAPAVAGDIYCPPHVAEADARQAREQWPDQPEPGSVQGPTHDKQTATDGPDTSTDSSTKEEPMTAPAVEEVQTNEGARRALKQMEEGAAELGEAAAMAEAAKAKIQAASQAAGDAMSAKAFDKGATAAVANINDIVSNDNLSAMSAAADEIGAAASKGLKDLEKYKDSENLVETEKVDPTTLAATQS